MKPTVTLEDIFAALARILSDVDRAIDTNNPAAFRIACCRYQTITHLHWDKL